MRPGSSVAPLPACPPGTVVRLGELERRRAEALVAEHGRDSLAPFLTRPDKCLQFAAGGVLAYRLVGKTAVVSGDPVGPPGSSPHVVAALIERVHAWGGHVVLYGSSSTNVALYRTLGLRALKVGEEAIVDPARFTLEGRSVRKLRQSVRRIERRGWRIEARSGREIDGRLEAEIAAVALAWRSAHPRALGFAMSLGAFDRGVRADDLYLLARSPDGELRGVLRFLSHCGRLSLDAMHRVGETPNGLNEALVCAALAWARVTGVREISLNYAGFAHVVRAARSERGLRPIACRIALVLLGRHFQMERLVRFNEKFSPHWRPRYIVYESRRGLPSAVVRVLQAEGYLPDRTAVRSRAARRREDRRAPAAVAAGLRQGIGR